MPPFGTRERRASPPPRRSAMRRRRRRTRRASAWSRERKAARHAGELDCDRGAGGGQRPPGTTLAAAGLAVAARRDRCARADVAGDRGHRRRRARRRLLWDDGGSARAGRRGQGSGTTAGHAPGRCGTTGGRRRWPPSGRIKRWPNGSAAARAPLIFRCTAVAATSRPCLAAWRRLPAGWSAVTPDGDLADARGLIVLRGRADANGGAAARRMHDAASCRYARRASRRTSPRRRRPPTARPIACARPVPCISPRASGTTRRSGHSGERVEEADAAVAAQERLDERAATRSSRSSSPWKTLERLRRRTSEPSSGHLGQLQAAAEAARAGARRACPPPGRGARGVDHDPGIARRASRSRPPGGVGIEPCESPAWRSCAHPCPNGSGCWPSRVRSTMRSRPRRGLCARRTLRLAADLERADSERGTARNELLALERDQGSVGGELADLERAAQATAIDASRREEALAALARERELALDGLPEVGSTEIPVDEIGGARRRAPSRSSSSGVRRTLARSAR